MERIKNRKISIFTIFSLLLLFMLVAGGTLLIVTLMKNTSSTRAKQVVTPVIATPTTTVEGLFTDHFADNSKGWSVTNVAGYTRMLQGNSLLLADTMHNVLVESVPTTKTFDDFSLTTTFTLLHADANDSVGLYIRGDSNLDHDYRIDIFGNNRYAISKETLNKSNDLDRSYLVTPSYSTSLKPIGQKNTLMLAMKGPEMVVQINGKAMHKLDDTEYTHGQIALFVSNGATSTGVAATFHDLVIIPLRHQ